jgi:hypothetical protein
MVVPSRKFYVAGYLPGLPRKNIISDWRGETHDDIRTGAPRAIEIRRIPVI